MGSNMSLVPPKKKKTKKIVEWEKNRACISIFFYKWFLKNPNKEFKKTIRESCPK